MKISFERHPSAPPSMRWSAIDDDTYDGIPSEDAKGRWHRSPMGWGATEAEAEQDLRDQIADWEDEQRIADEEEGRDGFEAAYDDALAFERQHRPTSGATMTADREIDAAQLRLESLFGKDWLEGKS